HCGGVDEKWPIRSRARGQRHSIQCRAERVLAPRRTDGLDKPRFENVRERPSDGDRTRHPVQLFERMVPTNHAILEIQHDEAVVEGLQYILVELAQAIELV